VDKFTLAQGETFILGRSDWQQITGFTRKAGTPRK
jgi:hypothetical protein